MNTAKSVLSIGVPVYNQAATIEKTIRSLLSQTIPPLEIVVSENHSTDGTDRVVSQYADRIRIVRPHRHLSMAENWNFLVEQLSGEWFSLLSGDDVALPQYVETLSYATKLSNKAVLIRAGWQNINEEGRVGRKNLLLSVRQRVRPPYTLYESLNGPKSSFAAFSARRAAWQAVGGFPEAMGHSCDWGFWIRLASEGEFIRDSTIIAQYCADSRSGRTARFALIILQDYIHVYKVLIPSCAARIPQVSLRRLERGRRQCFRDALNFAAALVISTDRPAAAALLRQLATDPREYRLVDDYQNGYFVARDRWRDITRRLLRGPLQDIISWTRINRWL